MNKLLGHEVRIQLKDGDVVDGIFFDSDDDSVYVQKDISILVAIPRENIKLYISRQAAENDMPKVDMTKASTKNQSNVLSIYVNDNLIREIPTHPSVNLMSFNDELLKIAMAYPDVQKALSGKIQTSMDYEPGHLYITVYEGTTEPGETGEGQNNSSFSMYGGGGFTNRMVDPLDMVNNLNNAIKRKKEQTGK